MKLSIKKILIIILINIVIIFLFAVNQFIDNTYDMSLYKYMQYSIPLTQTEIDYMYGKETLFFSSDNNAPPFAYIDKNSGQYKGLVLDYVNALSIELGINIDYMPQKWEGVISSVISGEADMCDVFPSEERKKYFVFSEPIYRMRAIVMLNKNSDITNAYGLSGHKVAIPSGDYAAEYVRTNIPFIEIVETSDLQDSLRELNDGRVEAVIGDEPVLMNFANELGINDKVKILDSALYDRDVCIGVRKSDQLLVNILNKGILNLHKKNFVEKIQQKWFGISSAILKHKVPENFMLLFIVLNTALIIIFMLTALWSYMLKIEVTRRTEDLNKSKNNLQITFDNLSSFLICIDEFGCIVNSNKSFRSYIKDKPVNGMCYRDIPILNCLNIDDAAQRDGELTYEGQVYLFSVSGLDYSDFKYIVVIEDITDRKLSQQQVLQQNKMIALGQLAAGVAHEIRNPIGLIQNYCYILKTYIFNGNTVAEDSINAMESSVQRVDKIINNLLNFSHADADKLTVVNIKELIMDIILLENKARIKNNIQIKLNCNDDIRMLTRTESLNHIFLNLLSNSIDSMPDGGSITVDCAVENNYLTVDFADNGSGISQEYLERIFNPFFTTKNVGQGTGLGLYIVYNEVQKIGGEIQVNSNPGQGTTFRLKIPMLKEMYANV